jgi:hypothetical protein
MSVILILDFLRCYRIFKSGKMLKINQEKL